MGYPELSNHTQPFLMIGIGIILGELASWGVQQSPYTVPDKLAEAVTNFKAAWPCDEYSSFDTINHLEAAIKSTIRDVPEIRAWNERKNGRQSPVGFSSAHHQPSPDDDFIDLDALARNIAMSAWRDAVYFKKFNDDFDRRHPAPSEAKGG